MADKEQKNDLLKNQDKNFNKNSTHENNPIIIDGCNVSECLFYQSNFEEDYDVKIKHFCSNWHNSCESANNSNCYFKQLARKTQECEELKKQLMQKSEVDMFFNTPIEGWSNDPCGICPHKAENEELKEEILTKNEKIKELRLSVSDLTNRLCYLNAEKSFRIVDLEQTLDEIEKELKEDIYCENQECGCDDFEECLKCTKEHILDIINKAKGEIMEITEKRHRHTHGH